MRPESGEVIMKKVLLGLCAAVCLAIGPLGTAEDAARIKSDRPAADLHDVPGDIRPGVGA